MGSAKVFKDNSANSVEKCAIWSPLSWTDSHQNLRGWLSRTSTSTTA